MKNLHITKPRSMNNPQMPRASHGGKGGPKATDGGINLQKGYNVLSPKGRSPGPPAINHGK